MKNDIKKRVSAFSAQEAFDFVEKADQLIQLENVKKFVLFVYAIVGFKQEAVLYFKDSQIAWCEDERLLENVSLKLLIRVPSFRKRAFFAL